jgi:hypothetical protein
MITYAGMNSSKNFIAFESLTKRLKKWLSNEVSASKFKNTIRDFY